MAIECFNVDEKIEKIDNLNSWSKINLKKDILVNNVLSYELFKYNIDQVLNNYGKIFKIDIEKLIKGTTYKVKDKYELINLINEDLNLIFFKRIIASRLCVVFYRLTYFDMEASKASIGRYFGDIFGKSESFKINLNRNPNGLFFTDLNNKIFRGYKIKPFEIKVPDTFFDLKIKIAKNLLSNNVKLKIVADAIDIKEEELKNIIYGDYSYNRNSNILNKYLIQNN